MRQGRPNRSCESAGRQSSLRREPRESEDETEGEAPSRAERLVLGAETGLRWVVQVVALLLWAGMGLVFWLPVLLRRTTSYVFAVLRSGLTGQRMDPARHQWTMAVAFYRVGFQRILRAFGDDDRFPDSIGDTAAGRRPDSGQLLFEVFWAAAVWTTVLWLTGLWPDAPAAIQSAAAWGWEEAATVASQLRTWLEGLL